MDGSILVVLVSYVLGGSSGLLTVAAALQARSAAQHPGRQRSAQGPAGLAGEAVRRS